MFVAIGASFAQNVNNEQRIIGTWIHFNGITQEDTQRFETWIFRADGTLTIGTNTYPGTSTYRYAVTNTNLIYAKVDEGLIYRDLEDNIYNISISSDGKTLTWELTAGKINNVEFEASGDSKGSAANTEDDEEDSGRKKSNKKSNNSSDDWIDNIFGGFFADTFGNFALAAFGVMIGIIVLVVIVIIILIATKKRKKSKVQDAPVQATKTEAKPKVEAEKEPSEEPAKVEPETIKETKATENKCPECGTTYKKDDAFCTGCGHKLK